MNKTDVDDDSVLCPIDGCENRVKRMAKGNLKKLDKYLRKKIQTKKNYERKFNRFLCDDHRIYITPTKFIYEDWEDNLFWLNDDKELVRKTIEEKRYPEQFHHNSSEDAVSWNVFRFLERNSLLGDFLSEFFGVKGNNPKIIYLGYSKSQDDLWGKLKKAREKFELTPSQGTEPDIIISHNNGLVIIEAKLNSNGGSIPKQIEKVRNKFVDGEKGWWDKIFKLNCEDIVNEENERYYQLIRLWLLGTWIARKRNSFHLVKLTRQERKSCNDFQKYVKSSQKREYTHITWESIYRFISKISEENIDKKEKDRILRYFENKTLGYSNKGKLKSAFSVN